MIEIIYTESALRFDVMMVWVDTYLLWNNHEADSLWYTKLFTKTVCPPQAKNFDISYLSCVISFGFWAFPKVANVLNPNYWFFGGACGGLIRYVPSGTIGTQISTPRATISVEHTCMYRHPNIDRSILWVSTTLSGIWRTCSSVRPQNITFLKRSENSTQKLYSTFLSAGLSLRK